MKREQWQEAAAEIARAIGVDRRHVIADLERVSLDERGTRALLALLSRPAKT